MSSARSKQWHLGGPAGLREWPRAPSRSQALWVAVAAVLIALLALLARRYGLVALAIPPLLAAVVLIATRPALAVAMPIVYAIVVEQSTPNVLGFYDSQIHDPLPGHLTPIELMTLLAVLAVVLDALRRERMPLGPRHFGLPLALIAAACLVGCVVGRADGGSWKTISEQLRLVAPLLVMPWLVVNVIRDTAALRRALGWLAALIVFKAFGGILGVLTGAGEQLGGTFGNTVISYYEATTNWLSLGYLLALVAAFASGIRTPRWTRWGGVIVLLSLILSYRRSFWLAAIASAPAVFVVCSGRTQRRLILPALAILAGALWISISSGLLAETQGPLAKRVQSLSPSSLQANVEDRYRLDERHNVLADLDEAPLTGLGFGVPWTQRYPLGVQYEGGQQYVHMAVLWWWMKMGLLGLIAYLALLACIVWQGIRVWRAHGDPTVRLGAIAIAGATLGLAVAEATASFTGVDPRLTPLAGALVGLLAAARLEGSSRAAENLDTMSR
ncbi:MAG TPA: O-antigen ligase family protein [Solirubrobacteraceae bacterium]|jgi:O-antigen ligase|nr:O-antigen ligase family protein [Solirubrobacteraceae bacterium]